MDCERNSNFSITPNDQQLPAIDVRQLIGAIDANELTECERIDEMSPCKICAKTFVSKRSLRIHEKVHNLGQFECNLCSRILTTAGFLRLHMQNMHNVFAPKTNALDGHAEPTGTSNCQCDICKMYFSHDRISRHMRSHVQKCRRPKCSRCPQTFSCMKNLQRHHKKQHGNENADVRRTNEYQCSICTDTFNRPIELYEHSKDHDVHCAETDDGHNLICDDCSECHENYERYARHMIDVHQVERVQPYKCRVCMLRYGSKAGLYMHINGHYNGSETMATKAMTVCTTTLLEIEPNLHGSGEKPFPCTYCSLRFKNRRRLEEHTRVHTGNSAFHSICNRIKMPQIIAFVIYSAGEQPYECGKCDKRFKTRMALGTHTKSRHTGVRDHLCSVCGKDFAAKAVLNEHMLLHTGERPFSCCHCDKTFRGISRLREHTRIHTGERPYICDGCSKAFRSHTNLRHHKISMHSDERRHLCTVCGKKFKFNSSLKTHMWTHNGDEKPYNCTRCKEGFMRLKKLKMHTCAVQEMEMMAVV